VTPPFSSARFDSQFFLVHVPTNQTAEVWPGELERGDWATADATLEEWTTGKWLLSPPTFAILDAVRFRRAGEFTERLAGLLGPNHEESIPPIYFAPDVRMIPLHTQALPPSTHTNAYLVGHGPSYLIDPGPSTPEEQARLFAVLDEHKEKGNELTAIVLTHHHPDHVGAAKVCAWNYEVPIWAHAVTAEKLEDKLQVNQMIDDGDILDLGEAPDGTAGWHLQAIHTPGHAPGHLAFYDAHYRSLIAGDMVSTLSSVVIGPPDGDLAIYLDSLQRLMAYDSRLLLPAHGNPSARPRHVLNENIQHRKLREGQLERALTESPQNVAALTSALYKGLPQAMVQFAQLQVLAGLIKLEAEGRARKNTIGDDFCWIGAAATLDR
jgi:ribonuclease/clavin/mitogillin